MDRHRSGIRGCLLILAMALLVPSQAACRNRALEQNGSSDSDWVLYKGQTIDEPNDDVVLAGSILSPVSGHADTVFKVGAERVELWLPVLKDKRVGVLVNHSSMVGNIHLLDTLLALGVDVRKVFAPEHGFRGDADAGARIDDQFDTRTGLPVVSLYGNTKKPSAEQMADLDVVVFDIQDVGVRFFTYISSMHYMMEACAEHGVSMVIFDRPNPNGDYIDGPILRNEFRSFVGMHPIPIVHGLTVGELALMINGQGWLRAGIKCDLIIVPAAAYTHSMRYELPVKPSPNLPNGLSIRLYPSLCLFEGTEVSVGRGTEHPFQVIGFPDRTYGSFSFVPKSIPGMDTKPLHIGKRCYGIDLRTTEDLDHRFTLQYLIRFWELSGRSENFISRRRFFNQLAGTDRLATQIMEGRSEDEIRASWKAELDEYKAMRIKYLIYPD